MSVTHYLAEQELFKAMKEDLHTQVAPMIDEAWAKAGFAEL